MTERDGIPGNWMEDTTREEKLNHVHEEAWEEYGKIKLEEFLERNEHLESCHVSDRIADFYIGGKDVYPDRHNDEHLNITGRSSVAFYQSTVKGRNELRFVTEVNIHLPAAPERFKEEIENELELDEDLGVYFGTGALGGMTAPDGVITPHIYHKDDITFPQLQETIEEAIEVYENVYNGGEEAIKQQPEEYR